MVANSFSFIKKKYVFEGWILKEKRQKEHLLEYKLLYTVIILLVYLVGKSIPLYGVDLSFYLQKEVNAEALLLQKSQQA